MKRFLATVLLAAGSLYGQNPNTAAFPDTVVTEQQATIQSNEVVTGQMALASGANSTTLTITLVDASNLIVPTTIQVNNEIILIASKASNDLTVFSSSLTANNCTNASPIVVTTTVPHALTGRERVTITGVTGNTNCNVTANSISVLSTTTFSLTGVNGNGAYTGGGAVTVTGRGFDGSTPATHVTGALVEPNIVAHHVNQHTAEIRALESQLGASLANVAVLNRANTFTGQPQVFTPSAATAAARILCAALPSTPVTGDIACDSAASNVFKTWDGSTWITLGGSFLTDPGGNGIVVRTALNTTINRSLAQPAAGFTITNSDGVVGNPTFALANDLAALEGLASSGFAARTAADTWAIRSLAQPAAGFTITNPAGTAGNPTFVLANDLAALEGLAGTGIAVRSGSDTWVQRTIVSGAGTITVTNGDGVAANPDVVVNQSSGFTWTGYHNFSSGQVRDPESTFAGLPTCDATNHGKQFIVTDALTAGSCSAGGGSSRSLCRCENGTGYEAIGGGGGSSLNVQNNDVSISNPADTLDFSTEFSVTESPSGEANVSLAGGGLGSSKNFRKQFTSTTSVTVTGAEHGFAHSRIIVQCYDSSAPRNWIEPNTITVNDSTFDVVITFSVAQTGECILSGSGGGDPDSAFGGIYISATAATGPITAGSYTKVAGTHTVLANGFDDFDEPVDGRLRYIGSRTLTFNVEACLSFTSNTITEARVRLATNGTTLVDSQQNVDIQDTTNTYAVCTLSQVGLATNDYVEVFITSDAGTPTITAQTLTLKAAPAGASTNTNLNPCWQKFTIGEAALTDADTSEDETLFTCTQFCKLRGAVVKHSASFTGGTLSAMTVSVGTASAPTTYTAAFDIFQATGDTVFQDTDMLSSATMAAAGHTVIAQFNSTGDNVVNATAGSVDIWVCSEEIQ